MITKQVITSDRTHSLWRQCLSLCGRKQECQEKMNLKITWLFHRKLCIVL